MYALCGVCAYQQRQRHSHKTKRYHIGANADEATRVGHQIKVKGLMQSLNEIIERAHGHL